jgi:ribonuclease-3
MLPEEPVRPRWPVSREDLETHILGVRIKDPNMYQSAFVHKSGLKDLDSSMSWVDTYERLEFMGDAVINMVVARFLYDKYPNEREGWLTRIRTKLVSGKCLCVFAQKLGLQEYILMNRKALSQGWNHNPRILEDCFEALVGALYFDMGMLTAKMFVLGMIHKHVNFAEIEKDDNWKDRLMRHTQALGIPLPVYEMREEGSPNTFEIHAMVQGALDTDCLVTGRGLDRNKKQAEQAAAKQALLQLGYDDFE